MNKFASLAALAVLPVLGVLFSAPVFASSPGHLAGGDLYQVRNVTKNTSYSNTATATCDEVIKYNFLLSNTEYGMLYDVNVNANLENGSATATAKNSGNEQVTVSDTASASIDKGSLSYVAGSTQLFSVDGHLIRALPDGITAGGVSAGNLAGSTREFVQFQAKVNCPTPPVVKNITVCELATKNIITIDEKAYDASKHSKNLADCAAKPPVVGEIVVCEMATKNVVTIKENAFDSSKHTKDLSKCAEAVVTPVTPTQLPQTGATGIIGIVASVIAAAAGYVVTARKNVLG